MAIWIWDVCKYKDKCKDSFISIEYVTIPNRAKQQYFYNHNDHRVFAYSTGHTRGTICF